MSCRACVNRNVYNVQLRAMPKCIIDLHRGRIWVRKYVGAAGKSTYREELTFADTFVAEECPTASTLQEHSSCERYERKRNVKKVREYSQIF